MRLILSAAIMPNDGTYSRRTISQQEAVQWLRSYGAEAVSYIGYPATAEYVHQLAGREVAVSRGEARFSDGDEALVIRLKYRMTDPSAKGTWTPGPDDFEFLLVSYRRE